jgi:hypothetical protein
VKTAIGVIVCVAIVLVLVTTTLIITQKPESWVETQATITIDENTKNSPIVAIQLSSEIPQEVAAIHPDVSREVSLRVEGIALNRYDVYHIDQYTYLALQFTPEANGVDLRQVLLGTQLRERETDSPKSSGGGRLSAYLPPDADREKDVLQDAPFTVCVVFETEALAPYWLEVVLSDDGGLTFPGENEMVNRDYVSPFIRIEGL